MKIVRETIYGFGYKKVFTCIVVKKRRNKEKKRENSVNWVDAF